MLNRLIKFLTPCCECGKRACKKAVATHCVSCAMAPFVQEEILAEMEFRAAMQELARRNG